MAKWKDFGREKHMPGDWHVKQALAKRGGEIMDEVKESLDVNNDEPENKEDCVEHPFIDPITAKLLDEVKRRVTTKDEDWCCVVDGREGCIFVNSVIKTLKGNFTIKQLLKNYSSFIDVLSYNFEKYKIEPAKARIVYSGKKQLYEIETEYGKKIQVTAEHQLYVLRTNMKTWTDKRLLLPVNKLRIGNYPDKLIVKNEDDTGKRDENECFGLEDIKSITKIGIEDTYDLQVEPNHNFFFGNGILSSNSGKSVLAMQICKYLDPNFSLERTTFNADQFTYQLKRAPSFSAILMDEAFAGANSRASMSEVNRALIAVATEMRQRNLFVVMCLPSIFDLDKYFALWRTKALFHVYNAPDGNRGRYIIFPFTHKKLLYISGRKTYNYAFPPSPFPALVFRHQYVVPEKEYRKVKAEAFRKRAISPTTARYRQQRDVLARWVWQKLKGVEGGAVEAFNEVLVQGGCKALAEPTIKLLVKGKQTEDLQDEVEADDEVELGKEGDEQNV